MTLVLAICCADGVVFAADSQSSFSTQGQWTKSDTEKLFVLGDRIAWGGSGPLGSIQRVKVEVDRHAADIVRDFGRRAESGGVTLHRHVHGILKTIADEALGDLKESLSSYLFGGLTQDGPFLMEVSVQGLREWRQMDHFSCIGSGDVFAMHSYRSLRHHDLRRLKLAQAQALAFRTVDDAIATAAFGLGGVVNIAVVDQDGARILEPQELAATRDAVDLWKRQEVEILGALAQDAGIASLAANSEPPAES